VSGEAGWLCRFGASVPLALCRRGGNCILAQCCLFFSTRKQSGMIVTIGMPPAGMLLSEVCFPEATVLLQTKVSLQERFL
jgi:hypothetical protein